MTGFDRCSTAIFSGKTSIEAVGSRGERMDGSQVEMEGVGRSPSSTGCEWSQAKKIQIKIKIDAAAQKGG